MKNILLLFVLIFCYSGIVIAQGEKPYEKVFYKEISVENGPITISIEDAVATEAYMKFKMRVKNNSSDYILVSTDNIVMKANGLEYKNLEKDLLIGPNDDDYRVIDIKGSGLRFDKFTLELKGFSKIPAESGSDKADNFKLPIVKNELTVGQFKLVVIKSVKKADDVVLKFTVDYSGDKIGIVHPGKTALLTPKGTEFVDMAPRYQRRPLALKKGQSDTFVILWKDIPASNGDLLKDPIEVVWHDCFREAVAVPLSLSEIEVNIDKELSDTKNKR